ncbi:S8 family serine peptidase, partial [Amaricoccus sp.]|uniref:S8 family serine peptidase n=1 Tax=Amaricoccus sp. TaxID=1872485 RepID=UPI001B705DC9
VTTTVVVKKVVVVEEVPAVNATKQVVQVEPKAAATAPRIRYSSGKSRDSYRRHELTALGLTPHARQVLGALGFRTISERRSPLLGNRIVARLRTPSNQTAEAALARARSVLPEVTFDLAHLYRPSGEQASVRYAANMIGAPLGPTCPVPTRVGLIDSGVGTHETLSGAKIVRKNFVEKGASTNVAHGTAIASILVGDLPGTGPLMPGAQLYSANVFASDSGGLRADATAIIAALDWIAAQRVPVVNLSLMGPKNALLEQAIAAAASRGLVMVAAAGNDGPGAGPAYPAAYPAVIAVSAVDARGRPYDNNNRGPYIYVAAPGVDIWGADARGGLAFWTGTSFAAPFVTASLARDIALGRVHDTNDGRSAIASRARDLGAPGRDPIYGFGLLQSSSCGGSGAKVLSAKN